MEANKALIRFWEGAIPSALLADEVSSLSANFRIGAHSIFLGQVRNDLIEHKRVVAIEYTAYKEMAEAELRRLCEEISQEFELLKVVVYHSLGSVAAGEISLLVLTAAEHRKEAIEACRLLVDRLKAEAPIWGKELFEDDSFQWKDGGFGAKRR